MDKSQKFYIDGMSCSNCSALIEKTLKTKEGISNVDISFMAKEMVLEYDESIIDEKEIITIVNKLGYKARIVKEKSNLNIKLIISIALLLIVFILANFKMFNIPLPKVLKNYYVNSLIQLILSVSIVVINFHYYKKGIKAIVMLSPTMDSLITVSSFAAILYGTLMIIFKAFDIVSDNTNNYFEAASMVIVLVSVGKLIEDKAKDKTTSSIKGLLKLLPTSGIIKRFGKEEEIKIEDIKENDVLVVKAGMSIPVDGIIINGIGSVDEAILTGEAGPFDKKVNDNVYKATILTDGYIEIKALKEGNNSVYDDVIRLVNETSSKKAKIGRLADKVCKYFVPSVMLISFITLLVWLIITKGDFSTSIMYAITVLVVSCPCALGLATPVAITAANGVASKNGVLIKNIEGLERLNDIKYVLCDKTGTVTKGAVEVESIIPNGISENEFLRYVVSIERLSNHPLSKEIAKIDIDTFDVKDFTMLPGKGISGIIEDKKIIAGNERLFEEENIDIKDSLSEKKCIYFAYNGRYIGKIIFNDVIKESSFKALSEFKKLGLTTVLISGDRDINTKDVASTLGFDCYYSDVFPEDKANIVKEYQDKGNTLFIGDGINDSIAIANSYASIAIGSGADVAKENADIILKRNDLLDAINIIKLSKKTLRIIKENLFWAFIYNIILIPVAFGAFSSINIIMKPSYASIAMCISSLFVVTNALRIVNSKYWKEDNMKLVVDKMMCEHCVKRIDDILKTFEGLVYSISLNDKSITIENADSKKVKEVKKALAEAGYKAK